MSIPSLPHHGDCLGSHMGWFCAGAENLVDISCVMAQQPFRHLTASRIAGAKDKYSHLRYLGRIS